MGPVLPKAGTNLDEGSASILLNLLTNIDLVLEDKHILDHALILRVRTPTIRYNPFHSSLKGSVDELVLSVFGRVDAEGND